MNDNKIKVSMTPNAFDVRVLHASQGDTEARKFEISLYDNEGDIDLSNIVDSPLPPYQVYKGGTEQILPINESVPVTSPFKGDIRYPDGLRTDQYFTYRECPSEEDGKAKVKSIKGNTIVWNQLVPPLSQMNPVGGTISVSNDVATITANATGISQGRLGIAKSGTEFTPIGGHSYLLIAEIQSTKSLSSVLLSYGNSIGYSVSNLQANTWHKLSAVKSSVNPTGQYVQIYAYGTFADNDTIQVRNWNYIDLTLLNDSRITDYASFMEYYGGVSYYSYNTGELVSFNGQAIKSTGKNLFDIEGWLTSCGVPFTKNGNKYTCTPQNSTVYTNPYIFFKEPVYVTLSGTVKNITTTNFRIELLNGSSLVASLYEGTEPRRNMLADRIRFNWSTVGTFTLEDIQIEFGSTESGFEPYTSSTTSLPISRYFPNGMRSAGNVYDELTESKAVTRIKSRTFNGSENWAKEPSTFQGWDYVYYLNVGDGQYVDWSTTRILCKCDKFEGVSYNKPKTANMVCMTGAGVFVEFFVPSTITSVNDWKTWLSNNPVTVCYVAKAEEETGITTASLVSEYGEIPLKVEDDHLVGECTSEFSENAGFTDCKIKLMDSDGEVYSNKIQLHVERSPQ